jgi:hypothetical protein
MNIIRGVVTLALAASGMGLVAGYATAAPVQSHTAAVPVPTVRPSNSATRIDDTHNPQDDFNNAVGVAANQVGLAATAGAVGGTVVGAALGCPIGAVTAGFTALPAGPIAVPAAALGCVAGAGIGVGLGAAIGTAVVATPVGIASAVQAYNTLHAAGDVAAQVPAS